jgi:acetylornithine/N-succinyldiaminopimelate aminotransferase
MKLFDVYKMLPIELSHGKDYYVYDTDGQQYLDFYGGHAVISIGHNHPRYNEALTAQLQKIVYYSNAVEFSIREKLAEKLGEVSGYADYELFLCNSGAEANENALKVASFHNGKKKLVAFKGGFHGRTSAAVSITDNPKIQAPVNEGGEVVIIEPEDAAKLEEVLKGGDVCAVVIEGVRGVGGIYVPTKQFMQDIQRLCKQYDAVFICDEIQSGYGRTGRFFAHQHAGVQPDLITVAKGMGNGFPVGGVLIHPKFKSSYGMLGTTFGGNPLACAACLAVLEVMESEKLVDNARKLGDYLMEGIKNLPEIAEISGLGLMIGITFSNNAKAFQEALTEEERVLTGSSSIANQIRLLPPLSIDQAAADHFLNSLEKVVSTPVKNHN